MKPVRVQLFARDPVPGRTKTRLIPALGAEGACRCYLCLLDATLACVREWSCDELEIWSDRAPEGPALRDRAAAHGG